MKIGIIGKMCSGKTTLANYIERYMNEKYDMNFKRFTFAGKVYDLAYELFDMDRKQKNRRLLQQIGTYMRMIDENVWVNYVIKKSNDHENVFVEDCRYENEFSALVNNDFILIKINIDEEYQHERLRMTYPETYEQHIENSKHASERDIDNLPESQCSIVLHARDNELNFVKISEFLDSYIGI
jgi:dephospho-CoA kinase